MPAGEAGQADGGNLPFIRPGLNGEVVPQADIGISKRLEDGKV
jgi:hypothetical protein